MNSNSSIKVQNPQIERSNNPEQKEKPEQHRTKQKLGCLRDASNTRNMLHEETRNMLYKLHMHVCLLQGHDMLMNESTTLAKSMHNKNLFIRKLGAKA